MQKLQFLDKLLENEDKSKQKIDYDELSYNIPRIWEHLYNLPIDEQDPEKGSIELFFNSGYYQFYVSEQHERIVRISATKQRIDNMHVNLTIDFDFPAKQIAGAFYGLMKKLDERKDKMQKLVKAFEKANLDVKAKILTQYGFREVQVRDANLDLGRNGHEHKILADISITDLRKNAGEKLLFDVSTYFGQPRYTSVETIDEVIQFFKDEQEAGFYR